MAKKHLSNEVKQFIVMSLASHDTPSETAEAVKEKFGIEISRQTAQLYDPTKVAGQDLSEELKTLFHKTRGRVEYGREIPISKKNVRLLKLQKYLEIAERQKDYKSAAAILRQAAKEKGGMFSKKIDPEEERQDARLGLAYLLDISPDELP